MGLVAYKYSFKSIMIFSGTFYRRNKFNVQWQLGTKCNFNCSYCTPKLNDGRYGFPTLELAKQVVDNIVSKAAHKNVTFTFQGGEVTLWEEFSELVKYIHGQGAQSILITNATRSAKYYESIAPYLMYTYLTFHCEESRGDRFVERMMVFHPYHLAVYIPMLPSHWGECVDLHHVVSNAGYRAIAKVIFDDYATRDTQRIAYTPEQTLFIDACNNTMVTPTQASAPASLLPKLPKFKGPFYSPTIDARVIQIFDNSELIEQTTLQNLLVSDKNNFIGYNCYAGIENLNISASGGVTASVCAQNGIIADIYRDPNFDLPDKPMLCKTAVCWCESDLMTRKVSSTEPTFTTDVSIPQTISRKLLVRHIGNESKI